MQQDLARGVRLTGRAPAALVLVQALVGEGERGAGVLGLVGQDGDTAGGRDREALAVLAQRDDRGVGELIGRVVVDAGQDAELVAAEAVGAAAVPHRRDEAVAEAGEQRVAGGVAVGVVVALEAVEVEEQDGVALMRAGHARGVVDVEQQAAAVAESGERIGEGFGAAAGDEGEVLGEGEAHSRQDACDRGDGEGVGGGVDRGFEGVLGEEREGDEAERPGHDEQAATVEGDVGRGPGRLPGGPAEGDGGGGPEGVEDGGACRPGGRGVQRGAVGDGGEQQAEADGAEHRPGAPADDAEDADDEGGEEEIAEGVDEVGDDGGRLAAGAVDDGRQDELGGEGADGERADEAVEPEAGVEQTGACFDEQAERQERRGVEGDPEHVGDASGSRGR